MMETKRKRGRPPGEHGPYKPADEIRQRYMIRLPGWIIERLKSLAKAEKTSAGKTVERALLKLWDEGGWYG